MGKIPLSFIMRREFINISSYLTAVICQQTIHSSSLEILIFLGHLFASCDRKQEIAGILCWNATLSCGQKFGKSPRNANFLLLLRKEKANRKKKKKKPVRQRRNLTTSISLKSLIIAWEKGNWSKKHLCALWEEIILSETDCVSFGSESH